LGSTECICERVTSAIEYRALGRPGLSVSALSLGTEYLLDVPREQAVAVIRRAVDGGINYFAPSPCPPFFLKLVKTSGSKPKKNPAISATLR